MSEQESVNKRKKKERKKRNERKIEKERNRARKQESVLNECDVISSRLLHLEIWFFSHSGKLFLGGIYPTPESSRSMHTNHLSLSLSLTTRARALCKVILRWGN